MLHQTTNQAAPHDHDLAKRHGGVLDQIIQKELQDTIRSLRTHDASADIADRGRALSQPVGVVGMKGH